MTIENEELSDDQLFNDAVGDEPEIIPETPIAEVEQPEKPEAEVVAESELTAEKPPVDDNAPQVPSYRLKQEADARRLLETDLANERADKAALRQRLEALERPAPKAEEPKASKPDPLLDPDGYEAYLEQKFEDKRVARDRETSLKAAHKTYKEEFEEAYATAQKHVDPALKARMQQSDDPGETLIAWHREQKTMREVGTDPNAWLEKKLEERLKDPTFLAKAVELARGSAQPQVNGRPRVELPPSLNGASRSNAALRAGNDDLSDEQLFSETIG